MMGRRTSQILVLLVFLFGLYGQTNGLRPLQPVQYTNRSITGYVGSPLYLTPYIKAGDIATAQNLSRVVLPLKGIEDQPTSYSGYLTVDDPGENHMFFWFIPATDIDPKDAPVVMWLQGGPGASSMFGLLEVHGPFSVIYEENGFDVTAIPNEYAWTKRANMIYMDNPIGAGFSYTETPFLGGLPQTQEDVAVDLYEALQQWFTMFPEYQLNEFFPFGESYAGKFVPTIGKKIHDENPTAELKINLVGLGMGDGWMSPPDSAIYAEYLYSVGLVDDVQKSVMLEKEQRMKDYAAEGNYRRSHTMWNSNFNYFLGRMGCDYAYGIDICDLPAEEDNYEDYLNLASTREAIHVGSRPFNIQSSAVYSSMIEKDFMKSERQTVEFMLERYKVLIYNGNFDIICDHYGVLQMFKAMTEWSLREEFFETESSYYKVDGETAGNLKSVGNLRMFVMRNAGHMVPRSQPKYALDMFEKFISGNM